MCRAGLKTVIYPEMHLGLYVEWLLKLSEQNEN
jgi:hypothetical protein